VRCIPAARGHRPWARVRGARSAGAALGLALCRCGNRQDKQYVYGATVSSAVKRSDWGLNAFVPSIGDDVNIQIEVEAMRKQ